MKKKIFAGIIGCGKISGVYTQTLQKFSSLEVIACADLNRNIADAHKSKWGIKKSCSVDELLSDREIDLVIILTPPATHAELSRKALEHNKHVYCEKPLALNRKDAGEIVQIAKNSGLVVGCAPDTVLGAGLQTARKIMDEGCIGELTGVSAFMLTAGPESWHPNPFFLYDIGGGPLFDMGPYYLTALIHLLGPVKRVAALGGVGQKERSVGSGPCAGSKIPVNVHTHLSCILAFVSGTLCSLTLSFDAPGQTTAPKIEIYGTRGTLVLSDPNTFGENVLIRTAGEKDFSPVDMIHGYTDNCRGIGAAELAAAIRHDRTSRTNASTALHVVDIMQALDESAKSFQFISTQTTCDRPLPFRCDTLWEISS
ncbi:MAG: Gfo/Idh/MocA family protein [Fibrobacterota bacterium]